MTTTGGDDVLLPALVREFKSHTSITDLLAEDEDLNPVIFQKDMQFSIEGTGLCGIVLWTRSGDPSFRTNYWCRRLVVDIVADPDRDEGKIAIRANAPEKAWTVQRELHPILQRPFGEVQFDNVKIITSVLVTGPQERDLADSEVMTLLRSEYEIEI